MASRKQKLRKERRRAWAAQWLHQRHEPCSQTSNFDVAPEFVAPPGGYEKMSEVLKEFAQPCFELCQHPDEVERLYALALVAWNAALLPQEERDELIRKTLATFPSDAREDGARTLEMLIRRKLALFAGNQRMMVDFELIPDEHGSARLNVVSSLGPPSMG